MPTTSNAAISGHYLPLRHLSACRRRDAGRGQDAQRAEHGLTMAKDQPAERTFPSGIVSVGLGKVERQVPATSRRRCRRTATSRSSASRSRARTARAKVTGATRFTVDISLPGMLYGRILRSPFPHARVRSIDVAAAAPSRRTRRSADRAARTIRRHATLRYVGAPVAAVAAVSMAAAEEALRPDPCRLRSRCRFVVDMDRGARRPQRRSFTTPPPRPQGHPSGFPAAADLPLSGNVRGPAVAQRGDVTQGFARGRCRRRGRVPHPGADALLPRAARDRRRLARRRPDRLHVDAIHRRRAA